MRLWWRSPSTGWYPAWSASRMTLAAAPEALQGAVAAGILGCGSVILGSSEAAGRFFAEIAARVGGGQGVEAAATEVIGEYRLGRDARFPASDIHCTRNSIRARSGSLQWPPRLDAPAAHAEIAHTVERLLPQLVGKPLAINVSGAIPAVLLGRRLPVAGTERRADAGSYRWIDRTPAGRAATTDWICDVARSGAGHRL